MTNTDTQKLATLLAKATPGPWYATNHFANDSTICNCAYVLSERYAGSICEISVDNGRNVADGGNDAPPKDEAAANANLIIAAVNSLPALLARITALEQQVFASDARLREAVERCAVIADAAVIEALNHPRGYGFRVATGIATDIRSTIPTKEETGLGTTSTR